MYPVNESNQYKEPQDSLLLRSYKTTKCWALSSSVSIGGESFSNSEEERQFEMCNYLYTLV